MCRIDRGLPSFHAKGSIALNPAQKNRLCADPLQSCLASLTETRIVRIFFPQPLPMHEHIDVVPFDHDALDRKIQRDGTKCLEVALGFFPAERSSWSIGIMSEARSDESFFTYAWRSDSTARSIRRVPFVIFGILNRLAAAADADQGYRAEQEQDGKQWEFVREYHGWSQYRNGYRAAADVKRPVSRLSPHRRSPSRSAQAHLSSI